MFRFVIGLALLGFTACAVALTALEIHSYMYLVLEMWE